MQKLLKWLEREEPPAKIILYVILTPIICVIYAEAVIAVLHFLNLIEPFAPAKIEWGKILLFLLIFDIVSGALYEEILFRLPLYFFIIKWGKTTKILIVAAIISTIFGFLHGGIIHIFIQGAHGFVYCLIFLKCGGFQNKYFHALFAAIAVHSIYNILVIALNLP